MSWDYQPTKQEVADHQLVAMTIHPQPILFTTSHFVVSVTRETDVGLGPEVIRAAPLQGLLRAIHCRADELDGRKDIVAVDTPLFVRLPTCLGHSYVILPIALSNTCRGGSSSAIHPSSLTV